MSETWNDQREYQEGERVWRHGVLYEAKMEICRRMKPEDPRNRDFWKVSPTIKPATARAETHTVERSHNPGYIKKVIV